MRLFWSAPRKWGRGFVARILRGVVDDCIAVESQEVWRKLTNLRRELRELRSAYIERYDAEAGSGLPARHERLETEIELRFAAVTKDTAEILQRLAVMEVRLLGAEPEAGEQHKLQRAKLTAALRRDNPGLAPYDD
ncbi:MAG: hypothetical protein KAU28_01135 [Phycisphaerae bacterium]|nr:hypothetical protein [Phycisphaerae bacterium]